MLDRHLAGDGQHGRALFAGVVQPVDQVQRAGAHCAGTHTYIFAKFPLREGREAGVAFVLHLDPSHIILGIIVLRGQRGEERIQGIARHTEDVAYTLVAEDL